MVMLSWLFVGNGASSLVFLLWMLVIVPLFLWMSLAFVVDDDDGGHKRSMKTMKMVMMQIRMMVAKIMTVTIVTAKMMVR